MRRKKVHITPRPQGRWAVKVGNNSRASKTYKKKSRAVKRGKKKAKKMAKKRGKTELLIHKRNGNIQRKHSYGRDPERYKG